MHIVSPLTHCMTLLTAYDVFRLLGTTYKQADLMVGSSYFEIYSGKVCTVLNV